MRRALVAVILFGCTDERQHVDPLPDPDQGPPPGNPNGRCSVPAEAALEDVSQPTSVVGTGTPASCTGAAFVAAVARGGVNTFTLTLCGVDMHDNFANEGGGAIFFVSNDRSGSLVIQDSTLIHNPSMGFETQGYPGIFVLANGPPTITNSTLQ